MARQDADDAFGARRDNHVDGVLGEDLAFGGDDLHSEWHACKHSGVAPSPRATWGALLPEARLKEPETGEYTAGQGGFAVSAMRISVHYAWVVAGITFLALLASAGIGATRAVLVLPLEQEFGWDRATISLALSINLLLFGLCGPFAGAIMARFGVRRVMLTALTTLALATGLSTFMQPAWQLVLLWGVVVGLGSGAMALVLGATVAARWFVRAAWSGDRPVRRQHGHRPAGLPAAAGGDHRDGRLARGRLARGRRRARRGGHRLRCSCATTRSEIGLQAYGAEAEPVSPLRRE